MGYFIADEINIHQRMGAGDDWVLDEPVGYVSTEHSLLIRAPKGFVTDFASVPWFARRLIPRTGKYNGAAIIHDFLYRCTTMPRAICDDIFLEAMKDLRVATWRRNLMYAGVRIGGGAARNQVNPNLTCPKGGFVVPTYP